MCGEVVHLTRQGLYEEVWSTPMAQLASQHGISDVGLAKICRKLGVPIPGRGYWQKKKAGQAVHQEPLPPLAEGQREIVTLRRSVLPARKSGVQARVDSEKLSDNLIVVEDTVSRPHPLVTKTIESLGKAKEDTCGLLVSEDSGCLSVKVGKDSLDRALRIMDALLKALDRRGFNPSVGEKKQTTAVVLGEPVSFTLEELLDRKERTLTPAQEKDKVRNPWKYARPQYDHIPSGRLSLKITDPTWRDIGRRSWSDGRRQRIENILNRFVAALIKAAAVERERRIQHEKWVQERAEEERRLWALFTDAECWQKSQQIRAYVQAVKDSAEKIRKAIEPDRSLEEWIAWALKQADRLDPLSLFSCCTREDRYDDPSPGRSNTAPATGFDLSWKRLLARSDYFERSTDWLPYRPNW